MTTRRAFLAGFSALVAAPAVILTPGLLMPVRAFSNAIIIDDPINWSAEQWRTWSETFDDPVYAAQAFFGHQPRSTFVLIRSVQHPDDVLSV